MSTKSDSRNLVKYSPCWLTAHARDSPDGTTVLSVYRSVRVTDTSDLYAEVRSMILSAKRVVVLDRKIVKDSSMVYGKAESITMILGEVS